MEQQLFESMYQSQPPWDVARPQKAFVELEAAGQIRGSVLDVGCGTGENALFTASRGHETWGIDFVPVAIERAKAKALERGIAVEFRVANALELPKLGRQCDTLIDSGLFHTFSDVERPVFVQGLGHVLRPGGTLHILCFSEHEPGSEGPRRVTQREIREAFGSGWTLKTIVPARFEVADVPSGPVFSAGGPKAWLATVERTAGPREPTTP